MNAPASTIISTHKQYIVATPNIRSGKPRINGRRITVADIASWYLELHFSIEKIAAEHNLTPAQIHAALAYYYDHRSEIDRREAEEQKIVDALKQQTPSKLQTKLADLDQ
ncbi:MAG: DUF433 domain-containing protein [Anaerolineales bacterium]|nr:DUF433 domain-containing protein [Anaerolineales bacterium]MCB9430782.1 DUF433 domain-containing protein [Ardenticatenaceae bacterium]